MRKPRVVDILHTLGWMASTPMAFRDAVVARGDVVLLRRGQQVYEEGDDGGGIFGVASGRLEVHVQSEVDAPTLAHLMFPGDWFGEIAAIDGATRRVTIVARVETRALRLTRADMMRIIQDDPAASLQFSQLGTRNFIKAIGLISMLRRDDPISRLAALLVTLLGPDGKGSSAIIVSQSDLGAMARLGRTTTNYALSKLEGLGLIECRYNALTVIDRDGLTRVGSHGAT